MKWIVTTTYSFDPDITAVEFSAEQEEKAEKYLQWAYERFLKIEREESCIPLNENACYIENRYAKIVWLDDTYAELCLSCTIDPEEEFEEYYRKSAGQMERIEEAYVYSKEFYYDTLVGRALLFEPINNVNYYESVDEYEKWLKDWEYENIENIQRFNSKYDKVMHRTESVESESGECIARNDYYECYYNDTLADVKEVWFIKKQKN